MVTVDTSKDNVVSNAYNFNVPCSLTMNASGSIHGNLANQSTMINIAVMAEGYRADQIDQYIAYVNDAFANPDNFQYTNVTAIVPPLPAAQHVHYSNDFYNAYWNNINVVRYDTISPEAGTDTLQNQDVVKSILNYNTFTGDADDNRIKAVLNESVIQCQLIPKNVDVVIILVNGNLWENNKAYSGVYDGRLLGKRNAEYIHYLIVRAPIGFDPISAGFHGNVATGIN